MTDRSGAEKSSSTPPPRPPVFARLLLWLFLSRRHREFIAGDLEELFVWRCGRGDRDARRWYVGAALGSIAARISPACWLRVRMERDPDDTGGGRMFRHMGSDLRRAWRGLMQRPGFTALAVATLSIGIGATTTVFAMANQALFRAIPGVTGADRAVFVELEIPESGRRGAGLGVLAFEELRQAATLFEALGGYGLTTVYAAVDGGPPVDVKAQPVMGDYFAALGVRPVVGRLFRPGETGVHADPSLVVISEGLWSRLFGRDPDVIGRRFRANRQTLEVIGVAGGGFTGPLRRTEVDAWVPISALVTLVRYTPERLEDPRSTLIDDIVGRLSPGISPETAQDQLGQILATMADLHAEEAEYLGSLVPRVHADISVDPLFRDTATASVRILLGIVVLVLVIACANVANLLLLRATRRRGEIAVRRALGASRGRVFAELQIESLLLALLGCAGGIAAAFGLAELFRGERLIRMPSFEGLAPDGRLLLFAMGAALLAGLLSGALPALIGGRVDPSENLREAGGRKTTGSTVARSVMTMVQVALSLALLVGALLLTRTIRNLHAVDLGMDPSSVHTFMVNASPPGYSGEESGAIIRRLYTELRSLPGVNGLGLDLYAPFGAAFLGRLQPAGDGDGSPVPVIHRYATPGYFETLGIPIVSGRAFREPDWAPSGSEGVILTRTLARQIFGEADAVGRTITTAGRSPETFTVIGVTADVHLQSPMGAPDATIWRMVNAIPFPILSVLLKTQTPGPALTDAIRQVVFSAAPDIPIADPAPLSNNLAQMIGEQRLFARLLTVLSMLAVFLAAIGLYGVIAWTVTERTREIGIRVALGARIESVARLVLTRVALLVVPGITLGLGGAVVIARLVESQLFGVTPLDAPTYLLAAVLFALVAIAACLAPMRTATGVDPVRALRTE